MHWRERAKLVRPDPSKKIVGDPRRKPVGWRPANMAECLADLDEYLGPFSGELPGRPV